MWFHVLPSGHVFDRNFEQPPEATLDIARAFTAEGQREDLNRAKDQAKELLSSLAQAFTKKSEDVIPKTTEPKVPQPTSDDRGSNISQIFLYVFNPTWTLVSFAFIGAYAVSVYVLYGRYVRRDLRASAYTSIFVRIVGAITASWILQALLIEGNTVTTVVSLPETWFVVAFGFGLIFGDVLNFAVSKTMHIMGLDTTAVKNLVATGTNETAKKERALRTIGGLTILDQVRLDEEDIKEVQNLVTSDVVQLLIFIQYPPERIFNWMDIATLQLALSSLPQGHELRDYLANNAVNTASDALAVYDRQNPNISDQNLKNTHLSLVTVLEHAPNMDLIRKWKQ